jgi:hypothetical protein
LDLRPTIYCQLGLGLLILRRDSTKTADWESGLILLELDLPHQIPDAILD